MTGSYLKRNQGKQKMHAQYADRKILAPLKPSAKNKKRTCVLDIETHDWIKFAYAATFDGLSYVEHDSIENLISHLFNHRNHRRTFFAHNGGRFDFLFILEEIKKIEKIKIEKMIFQGSSLIFFEAEKSGVKVAFQDTFPLFKMSLKKIGETFTEKKKLTGAIDFEGGEKFDKNNHLHREYLKLDCEVLFEAIEKLKRYDFAKNTGLKLTISSQALAHFRTNFLKETIFHPPMSVKKFIRKSMAGGRTEIFKFSSSKGAIYDVNSMYPAVMAQEKIPVAFLTISKSENDFGFHEIEAYVPKEIKFPILWVRQNGRLIFPTGNVKGIYFSEEIKLAKEMGAKIKFIRGYKFSQRNDLFKEYIDECFKMRSIDSGHSEMGKRLMNHLFGKFGQKSEREEIFFADSTDLRKLNKNEHPVGSIDAFFNNKIAKRVTEKESVHSLPHIAAAITAHARCRLTRALVKCGDRALYCDTDSIFLEGTEPAPFQISNKLGDFKLENEFKKACFILPKTYALELMKGKKVKMKGFPEKFSEKIAFDDFKIRKIPEFKKESIFTLKRSLVSNQKMLSKGVFSKSLKAHYDKRILNKNNKLIPVHLN